VFKRNMLVNYQLKMKTSRAVFSEIAKDYPVFPFAMRQLADERSARLAIKECVDHDLLVPYPVLFEKPGDLVAHFKYTVLLMPNGNVSVTTGLPLAAAAERFASEVEVPAVLLELITREDDKKKKKKQDA
jgi:methionine aminopeptidase